MKKNIILNPGKTVNRGAGVEVIKVSSHRQVKRFVSFPFTLFNGNKFWCPPLRSGEIRTLCKDRNPAFECCDSEYWMAYRDGRPVGRIAGIINHRANEHWNDKLVRFSWIDFIDDPDVSFHLIKTVSEWGKEHGMTGICGPFGFTNLDSEGMLVDGFDEMGTMGSAYNPAYYPEHMIRLGFQKAKDWIQFELTMPDRIPEKFSRMTRIAAEKYGLHSLKPRRKKELYPYARKLFTLYNESFRDIYGFAALSDAQIDHYTRQYFRFIRPEFVSLILDRQDEIVGFGITMPDLSNAIQKCHGNLFPFGIIRLFSALRKNDRALMCLVGVKPDYQGKGVMAMVYHELNAAFLQKGIKKAVTNPQLEENINAISVWKNYKNRIHIRRRCWIKPL